MDTPLTLDEMRTAVGDLTAAFVHHQPLTDHQWDQAISTLLTAREQHGGRIRRLIHVILDAGHPDHPADALPDALDELHCHLAIADHPPPDTTTRRRRRSTRPAGGPHTQLSLFSPALLPDTFDDHVSDVCRDRLGGVRRNDQRHSG